MGKYDGFVYLLIAQQLILDGALEFFALASHTFVTPKRDFHRI